MRANPPMAHANPFPSLSRPKPAVARTRREPSITITSPNGREKEVVTAQTTRDIDIEKNDPQTGRPSKLERAARRLPPWKFMLSVLVVLFLVVVLAGGLSMIQRKEEAPSAKSGREVGRLFG